MTIDIDTLEKMLETKLENFIRQSPAVATEACKEAFDAKVKEQDEKRTRFGKWVNKSPGPAFTTVAIAGAMAGTAVIGGIKLAYNYATTPSQPEQLQAALTGGGGSGMLFG